MMTDCSLVVCGLRNEISAEFYFQCIEMKPKVRPTSNANGDGQSMKVVRFAATPSLVNEDLTSLVEICHKSMVHQNWPISCSEKQKKSDCKEQQPYVPPNDEEIYEDLRKRGLKIKNQR